MSTTLTSPAHSQHTSSNLFARALAEARGGVSSDSSPNYSQDAVQAPSDSSPNGSTFNDNQEQQRLQEQLKYKQLRADLHRRIHPTEQREVFNAREAQVKQEIDSVRKELQLLSQEVTTFNKEIEMTLFHDITEPGETGKYYLTFYQKLREFIILLRKKVHSARTWAHTFQSKKSRQPGLNFGQSGHKQTKTVWDSMHHERSLARAGN